MTPWLIKKASLIELRNYKGPGSQIPCALDSISTVDDDTKDIIIPKPSEFTEHGESLNYIEEVPHLGAGKFINCAFFETYVMLDGAAEFNNLKLSLIRHDDAVAIYVYNHKIPQGDFVIGYTTKFDPQPDKQYNIFEIPSDILTDGTNRIVIVLLNHSNLEKLEGGKITVDDSNENITQHPFPPVLFTLEVADPGSYLIPQGKAPRGASLTVPFGMCVELRQQHGNRVFRFDQQPHYINDLGDFHGLYVYPDIY